MIATRRLVSHIPFRSALPALGLVGLLVFVPKTLTQAAGTTYYVDPAGDNGNSGTSESSPWKDFTRVAGITLQPGDRVLLRRGGAWDQTLTIRGKGTQSAFIEIGAYGSGARPKICGSSPMNTGTGFIAFRAMRLNNPSYLKVSSLEVCNGGAGIVVYYDGTESGNRSVYFDDIVAHDFYGISQGSGEANVNHQYYCRDAGAKYVDQDRNYFPKSNWRDYRSPDYVAFSFGIGITGDPRPTSDRVLTDIRVTNSEIYRTGGGIAIDWDDGHNGHVNTVAEFLIDHVYLHDNDVPAVSLASIFFKNCTDCRITNTVIDRGICTAPYGTSAIFLGGQMRLVMDNVTINHSPWDPSTGDSIGIDFEGYNLNVTIRNGWFENNAGGAIQFYNNGGPATDFLIENNVFVQNAAGEARDWGGDGAAQIDVSNWPSGGGHRGTIQDNWYVNWCGNNDWGEPVCTRFYRADSGNSVTLSNNQEGLPPVTPTPPSPTPNPTSTPTPGAVFVDVPFDHPYHDEIEALYRAGYTAGCNTDPLMYCPEATMNRAESAVFVERGIHGTSGLPPQPTTQTFADLPLDSWAAKWAEALWQDHYTAGCGTDPLIYCPWQGHTRAEGCVFYLHMLNGPTYQPPQPSQQTFVDVPLDAWYAKWVQAGYDARLLEPCQTTPDLRFCPDDPLSRALAAYMMVQAKGLDTP